MDWKVYVATFTAVFFAELADKTQLVGIGMASKSGKPFSVWLGSICAYIIVTALSVLAGALLGKYIRPELLKYFVGFLFVAIGLFIIFGKA